MLVLVTLLIWLATIYENGFYVVGIQLMGQIFDRDCGGSERALLALFMYEDILPCHEPFGYVGQVVDYDLELYY